MVRYIGSEPTVIPPPPGTAAQPIHVEPGGVVELEPAVIVLITRPGPPLEDVAKAQRGHSLQKPWYPVRPPADSWVDADTGQPIAERDEPIGEVLSEAIEDQPGPPPQEARRAPRG